MNTSRLIQEADAVAWIERTKGGHRAAAIIEQLLARVRELEREHRRDALRAEMRQDVADVRKLMRGEGT